MVVTVHTTTAMATGTVTGTVTETGNVVMAIETGTAIGIGIGIVVGTESTAEIGQTTLLHREVVVMVPVAAPMETHTFRPT